MKANRIQALLLGILILLTSFGITTFAAEEGTMENGGAYITYNYSDICDRIVNGLPNATLEKNVFFEGYNALKITPTPETASAAISLDSYSMHKQNQKVYIPKYKYLGITYYYATDNPAFSGKIGFELRPGTTAKVVKSTLSRSATLPVVTNQWTEAIVNFNTVELNPAAVYNYIQQFRIKPFGGTNAKELSSNDVMYISTLTFYEKNPDPNATTKIEFVKGRPEARGDEIVYNIKDGEDYTLPECPYTCENAEFTGWEASDTGAVYKPGEVLTAAERDVKYTATWKVTKIYPDFVAINFSDYQGGIVSKRKTATLEKTPIDGKTVLKVIPNPEFDAAVDTLTIDGVSYKSANAELGQYNWMTIEYLYESPTPITGTKQFIRVFDGTTDVLKDGVTSVDVLSEENIVSGKWTTATYNLASVKEALNPFEQEHILSQMHIRPFGNYKLQSLSANEHMYIRHIVFHKEKPTPESHTAYMTGYADGTFLPSGTMTRAEACTVISRLLETEANIQGASSFADVPADAWFAKYVGYCQARGLLGSYNGNFLPNQPITRAEFSELVFLTGLAKDKGIAAAFTDVPASHARYASIMAAASAGLINGYLEADGTYTFRPDNTITRAEVVTVINRARGTSKKADDISDDIILVFTDIDDSHWAFGDIAQAAIPHTEMNGKWLHASSDPLVALKEKIEPASFYDIAGGNAKVAELDALEKARISEIRNTPNMDLSAYTGKKLYVSQSLGSDDNDGLSPEKPLKTIAAANKLIDAGGGAVLLRRGDLWREPFSAKANTIYTAYGEGAKPTVYGSPENGADPSKWTLVYENKETGALIWKYAREDFTDVGTIVFNDGEGFALKEIPSYNGKEFLLKSDPSKVFDYRTELDKNYEMFHAATSVMRNSVRPNEPQATGPFYLRCDNGNPGSVFESIEFNPRKAIIACGGENITVDNLRLMYTGGHAISVSTKNQTFTNLEIGWIGGSVHTYSVSGEVASATRYGNGIEVYGPCDGYTIDNCYVYECYDAGITHQLSSDGASGGAALQNNVKYSNNVLVDNVYNVEYFLGTATDENAARSGENIVIENNLMRRAGYGFGSTRPSVNNQRHIRSGASRNEFTDFYVRNNIFDRAVYELIWSYTQFAACVPVFENNTYIQGVGNRLFEHGNKSIVASADITGRYHIRNTLGDKTASIYFVDYIPPYAYSYTNTKTVPVTDAERAAMEKYIAENAIEEQKKQEEEKAKEVVETNEVLPPLITRSQKGQNLYKALRDSFTVETQTDADTGIVYAKVNYIFNPAMLNMDCYGLSPEIKIPETHDLYFKILIRTNKSYKPYIRVFGLKNNAKAKISGNKSQTAETETLGNGTWEQIIIKVEDIPEEAVTTNQIHLYFAGSGATGSEHFDDDGNLISDAYYHIAAWGAFSNRASAEAFDLATVAVQLPQQ